MRPTPRRPKWLRAARARLDAGMANGLGRVRASQATRDHALALLLATEELDRPDNPYVFTGPDGEVRAELTRGDRLGVAIFHGPGVPVVLCRHQEPTPFAPRSYESVAWQNEQVAGLRDLWGWVRGGEDLDEAVGSLSPRALADEVWDAGQNLGWR